MDLLDLLIAELNKFPPLVSDRFLDMHSPGKRASRRIMIHLRHGRKYSNRGKRPPRTLLREHFF